jgi:hypothetical protein
MRGAPLWRSADSSVFKVRAVNRPHPKSRPEQGLLSIDNFKFLRYLVKALQGKGIDLCRSKKSAPNLPRANGRQGGGGGEVLCVVSHGDVGWLVAWCWCLGGLIAIEGGVGWI